MGRPLFVWSGSIGLEQSDLGRPPRPLTNISRNDLHDDSSATWRRWSKYKAGSRRRRMLMQMNKDERARRSSESGGRIRACLALISYLITIDFPFMVLHCQVIMRTSRRFAGRGTDFEGVRWVCVREVCGACPESAVRNRTVDSSWAPINLLFFQGLAYLSRGRHNACAATTHP